MKTRIYAVVMNNKNEEVERIQAESLDEALKKARQHDTNYCGGRVVEY